MRSAVLCLGIFAAFLAVTSGEHKWKKEDNIVILTEEDFDKAVKNFKQMLVMFHAPWCGICRGFMKDYKKAAEILKEENSKIVMATVNGEIEKGLTKRFNLPGFPIVKFYKNGNPINYTGGRGAKNVVKWLKKQTSGN